MYSENNYPFVIQWFQFHCTLQIQWDIIELSKKQPDQTWSTGKKITRRNRSYCALVVCLTQPRLSLNFHSPLVMTITPPDALFSARVSSAFPFLTRSDSAVSRNCHYTSLGPSHGVGRLESRSHAGVTSTTSRTEFLSSCYQWIRPLVFWSDGRYASIPISLFLHP